MINKIKTLIEMYYLQFLALCEGVTFPPDGLEAQINNLMNGINKKELLCLNWNTLLALIGLPE